MTKYFSIVALACIILLASCSTSKQARAYRADVDGTWQLQTVVSDGVGGVAVKAQVFNEQDFSCFIGSTWKFNKSNSLGSYEIDKNGGDCASVKRNIRWSIYEEPSMPMEFQFKRLDDKLNAMDGGAGFRMRILQLTSTNMQLRSDVTYLGKPISFTYNFVRM